MEERIEDILARDGKALRLPIGISMWPLLRNRRDMFVVEPVNRELRVGDVVLYPKFDGHLIFHRIVKIRENDYVIRGDNNLFFEYGINDEKIIAVMSGFYRGNRYIDCETSKGYKAYMVFERITHVPRVIVYRVCRKVGSLLFKMLKKGKTSS